MREEILWSERTAAKWNKRFEYRLIQEWKLNIEHVIAFDSNAKLKLKMKNRNDLRNMAMNIKPACAHTHIHTHNSFERMIP